MINKHAMEPLASMLVMQAHGLVGAFSSPDTINITTILQAKWYRLQLLLATFDEHQDASNDD